MTVNLNLSDTLLYAVKTKLDAEMATRVATINAALDPADPAQIQTPAQVLVDYINEVTQTPTLMIVEGPTPRLEWEGTHGFITNTHVYVVIVEEHTDRQVLARKLRHQARAVVESVWDGAPQEALSTPAASGTRIRPVSFNPGPLSRETATSLGAWRSMYVVTFLAKQLEGL